MTYLPEGLLEGIRNYLDITWADPAGDRKLEGLAARGIAYLNHAAGQKQNYSMEGAARSLLFDYIRYARANSLHEFQDNYLHELIALQMQQEVHLDGESE